MEQDLNAAIGGPALSARLPTRARSRRCSARPLDSEGARVASWRYVATNEASLIEQIQKANTGAANLLKQARALTQDKAFGGAIDELSTIVPAFTAVINDTIKALDQQGVIGRERAIPVLAELDTTFAKTKETTASRAVERATSAAASRAQSSQIALGLGVFVVLALIGSAVFGSLTIARPIRRIGEVLLELANGNKAVDVPYAARGDEVGDAARAAQTFKENILRIEKMKTEQRETEQRAATGARRVHSLRTSSRPRRRIDAVSTASSGMETANTLSKTAERTQELSAARCGRHRPTYSRSPPPPRR